MKDSRMLWRSASAMVAATAFVASVSALADPTPERQADLVHLIRQDCGSCHGMTLKGGLGPPLLPNNLAEVSDEALVETILMGRPDSPMPPWHVFLSEAEAQWMVKSLKHGLGE